MESLHKKLTDIKTQLERDMSGTEDPKLKAYVTGRLDQLKVILPMVHLEGRRNRMKFNQAERERV